MICQRLGSLNAGRMCETFCSNATLQGSTAAAGGGQEMMVGDHRLKPRQVAHEQAEGSEYKNWSRLFDYDVRWSLRGIEHQPGVQGTCEDKWGNERERKTTRWNQDGAKMEPRWSRAQAE